MQSDRIGLLLVTVLMFAGLGVPAAGKEKVILDDDSCFPSQPVIMLLNSDHVDLIGITRVAGGSWLENCEQGPYALLQTWGRTDIPVIWGAGEPLMGNREPWYAFEERLFGNSEYLGAFRSPRPEPYKPREDHAVDFIVRKVKEFPNEVTLLAMGPATNIALAVKKNPEIVPLVKRIIYMGGAIDMYGNTTPAAEFNFWFDPEAAKIALRTPFKEQIVLPTDICVMKGGVQFTKAIYDRIAAAPETPLTQLPHLTGQNPLFMRGSKFFQSL